VAVLVNGLSRKPTRPGTQLSSLHRTAEKPAATKEKREETERLGAAKQRAAKRRKNDGTEPRSTVGMTRATNNAPLETLRAKSTSITS
jgi:hypothetical protein